MLITEQCRRSQSKHIEPQLNSSSKNDNGHEWIAMLSRLVVGTSKTKQITLEASRDVRNKDVTRRKTQEETHNKPAGFMRQGLTQASDSRVQERSLRSWSRSKAEAIARRASAEATSCAFFLGGCVLPFGVGFGLGAGIVELVEPDDMVSLVVCALVCSYSILST
jgi:hypothetical protein